MPKYWWKQIFSLGSFPEVGQKQKMEKKERRETKRYGARKAAWANVSKPKKDMSTSS